MYGTFVIVVVLLFIPLADIGAEEASSVVPGARVRITAPSISTKRIIGQITAIDADTLVLRHKPSLWFSDAGGELGILRISFDSLTGLEVSQRRHGLGGPVMGAILGIGVVVLLDATEMLGEGHEHELALIWIAPISVTVGTVLGALIARRDRWERVPLDHIRVGILPQRLGKPVLSASFTF